MPLCVPQKAEAIVTKDCADLCFEYSAKITKRAKRRATSEKAATEYTAKYDDNMCELYVTMCAETMPRLRSIH